MEFEKIFTLYFQDVYKYLLSISKNPTISEEITSEVFFKALKNIESFRGDSTIKTYLISIAKNSYFDYLKRENKEVSLDEIEFLESKYSTENEIIRDFENKVIRDSLDTLKEPYQSIIKLRIWEDMSFSEIGKVYGKTANWACVTFHRGKKMLKDILEEKL